MVRLLEWVFIFLGVIGFCTACTLLIRWFNHKLRWANRINENALRRAILEEADVQFEVAPDGFIRPVPRTERGHKERVH